MQRKFTITVAATAIAVLIVGAVAVVIVQNATSTTADANVGQRPLKGDVGTVLFLGNSSEGSLILHEVYAYSPHVKEVQVLGDGRLNLTPKVVFPEPHVLLVDTYWYSKLGSVEKKRVTDELATYWHRVPVPSIVAFGPETGDVLSGIPPNPTGSSTPLMDGARAYSGARGSNGSTENINIAGNVNDASSMVGGLRDALNWGGGYSILE